MKHIIIHSYSIEKLLERINEEMRGEFRPKLAFIFCSVKYNIRKLVAELNIYPFIIFGATTAGEIFADKKHGVNSVDESIVCMLLDINPKALAFKLIHVEGDNYYKSGVDIGNWAKSKFKNPAIITATAGLTFDNDAYVQGILSNGIEYAFGGAAGDDLILKDTFVFSKDNYTHHGAIVLAIDRDKIEVVGSRAFGWAGIGKERIVTKADKNIVYTIDGKPAVDFYKGYLNITSDDMPQTGIEYPLEVTMKNGQVVYRAVLDINEEDGSLIFAGHGEERSKVRISAPRGKKIINFVEESVKEAIDSKEDFTPDIALLFPCCSRKQVLGQFTIKEIEAVYSVAQTPLIGCFVYGEIGAFPGGYGFHNETFVTALLKEKE